MLSYSLHRSDGQSTTQHALARIGLRVLVAAFRGSASASADTLHPTAPGASQPTNTRVAARALGDHRATPPPATRHDGNQHAPSWQAIPRIPGTAAR
jgi:hypothetical protein